VPTFVGVSRGASFRPGKPHPERLATGDLLTNRRICEKVRLAQLRQKIARRCPVPFRLFVISLNRPNHSKNMSTVTEEPPTQNTSACKGGPVKEHELLQKFVGEWESEGEAFMAPGQPPTKLKGVESSR
jgi:hypothetical protein